jgi:hypothetical protein
VLTQEKERHKVVAIVRGPGILSSCNGCGGAWGRSSPRHRSRHRSKSTLGGSRFCLREIECGDTEFFFKQPRRPRRVLRDTFLSSRDNALLDRPYRLPHALDG